ncbi:DUF1904 family protein [Paenibacillus xerothermodurans]|uniref:DUF1904 family protein n=1 Tax=Paenibacillus xerothermodurans TaxID=1977292 RepID=A0A2W1NPC0_PAEXE|nr:DUF1904 family protein [Paenibacillus xerothermodurans]PZE19586.1 DUF1904 family protein [Paenibacillus xerothermodurans]
MPYLRFTGFAGDSLRLLAPRMTQEFAQLVNIEREKVKIELIASEAITQVPLSLQIMMFPRKQETHDAIAAALHHILREAGYDQVHIFFVLLTPSLYYKNGEPLTAYELHNSADG